MKKICIAGILLFLLPDAVLAQASAESTTTFILVRHAEKTDDSHDPDLSPEGYARASLLATMLENIPIDAIYSTPYRRTLETVKPVADFFQLNIQEYDPGNPEKEAEDWFINHKGQHILVAGHSNTTPAFANALLGREHFKGNFDESDYANLLIITIATDKRGHLLHLKF